MTRLSFPPLSVKPADWVVRFADSIPRIPGNDGMVLDLACGCGRHATWLSQQGYRVLAVDRTLKTAHQSESIASVQSKPPLATHQNSPNPQWIEADLESRDPFSAGGCLHGWCFSGIIVVNYLYRPLFDGLINALKPGGVLIYETFAQGHDVFGRPRNPAYLLKKDELLDRAQASDMTIIAYQYGRVSTPSPAIRQSLCARKNPSPHQDQA